MKKITALIIIFAMIILSGCAKQDKVSGKSESETDIRNTAVKESEEAESETLLSKTEYGNKGNSYKTFTGLAPLEKVDFTVTDKDNSRKLSNETVAHSFGVAKNETANDISINSQKYFDEYKFKALTLDTKSTDKRVYLTFDVGYDNGYTGQILDTLKEKEVPAAFFCTVPEMQSDPGSIARMINEGHIVGNHTKNHPSMPSLSRTEMTEEIKACDDYLRENFGYSAPYFRFPKGEYSDNALDLVGSLGYTSVFWSLAYADWDINNQKGAKNAIDTVVSRIHPGAVILLHAVSSDNANALGDIIDEIRKMGYEFVSLDDYVK